MVVMEAVVLLVLGILAVEEREAILVLEDQHIVVRILGVVAQDRVAVEVRAQIPILH